LAIAALRDRDAIVTKEGLIFRVFGYTHLHNSYICDVEYAPAAIFESNNPKAFRNQGQSVFYKFYDDEGWKFLEKNFPQYMVMHEMLQKRVVGVDGSAISEVRKPEEGLKKLIQTEPKDSLVAAAHKVSEFAANQSGLPVESFGVFGSLLHGFHNPRFSDIDLIIYGNDNAQRMRKTLQELYESESSPLRNEFETDEAIRGKAWRFQNYDPTDYLWHQRRKSIYSLYRNKESERTIKTEFEPVKNWREIHNEYDPSARILQRGWIKILARITNDSEGPFIPSIYQVEPLEILEGERQAQEVKRIISYIEEFRMQASKDDTVYAEGNLEEVTNNENSFFQIALTYCPRYYEQVLKTVSI
jgi:predicted nucleotidyltransferase